MGRLFDLSGQLYWSLMLFCLLISPATAALDVAEATTKLNLGPHMQILEDRDHALDIADLLDPEAALEWQPSNQQTINFSFSDSAWWLRVALANRSGTSTRRLLELAMPLPDYLDVWIVDESSTVVQRWQTGSRRNFDTRPMTYRTFVVPISLPPGETYSVILRLDTHDGLFDATPLYLMDANSFLENSQYELMTFIPYFGALMALMIYNLLIFWAIRELDQLYYVAYLGSFFILMFIVRGFAFQYWWPTWPTFNKQMLLLSIGVFVVLLVIFSSSYLNLRRYAPRWNRALFGLAGLCFLSVLPALQGHYASVIRLVIPLGILLSLLILGVAIWRSWLGDISARIFIVARSVLLVGVTLYFLRIVGVLPYNVVTEYAIQVGSGLEFLLLAFGLAYKINQLKNEKLEAVRATRDLQRSLNQLLEAQVAERTHALEKANRQLTAIAQTDPLTGLLNRRQFHDLVDAELRRRRRDGQAILFVMMDVDAFKLYNDTYGHRAGDQVLRRLSALLQQHFRRAGDHLFRLGGEEFGLLLEASTLEEGQHAVENFRRDLEALAIPHRLSAAGVVTASFGFAYCNDFQRVTDVDHLYQLADDAMYEAKRRSRNQVIIRTVLTERGT
ncbi:MAG TPA: diguanylate cyclase [Halomonas sp.]|nr:diguanylate cyclase [Halomonas sp.]